MSDLFLSAIELAGGRIEVKSQVSATRTIRLFLSSTFNDFRVEREALHKKVFPLLLKKCDAVGFQFQVVDLRWGVSEEAVKDHKTIDICLGEVRRCQQISPHPNFLVLLGQRYGWQPPPARIPDEEFRLLVQYVNDSADRKLIEHWYLCDENNIPHLRILRPRQEDYVAVETRLRDILRTAAIRASLPENRLDHYQQSATGLEIIVGALDPVEAPNADQHVHVFSRRIDELPMNSSNVYIDWNANHNCIDRKSVDQLMQLEDRLKKRLPEDHYWSYRERWKDEHADGSCIPEITNDGIDELCEQVLMRMGAHIDERVLNSTQHSPLDIERIAHAVFAEERSKHLIGRESELEYVARFLSDNFFGKPVLLVHGTSGCGKSALLAGALSHCRHDEVQILARYIGITPLTGSAQTLLNHLFEELGGNDVVPESEDEVRTALAELLTRHPTVIALDAIDQLPTHDAIWLLKRLPKQFPKSSRLLLTCSEEHLANLKSFLPDHQAFLMQGLEQAEAELLLNTWLYEDPRCRRTVTSQQRNVILDGFRHSGGLPLYLRIAATIAREWFSWTSVQELPDTLPALITKFFDNLSSERGHGTFLAARALALIAASRQGMAEEEITDILGQDCEVLREFKERHPESPPIDGLPPILWSRLYHDLVAFLSEREAQGRRVLSFFHRQFLEVATRQWLEGDAGLKIHRKIADYFESQKLFLDGDKRRQPNARKTAQLPWHLEIAGDISRLYTLLQNFDFVMAKCQVGQVDDLIGYYLRLPSGIARDLKIWRDFMIGSAHILRRGNAGWPTHKILLQLAIEHADSSPLTRAAESWLSDGNCDWPWLRNSYRPAALPWNPQVVVIQAHKKPIERVIILSNGLLLSWASEDNCLILSDPNTGQILQSYLHQSEHIKGVFELTSGILSWDYSNLYFWAHASTHDQNENWIVLANEIICGALQLPSGKIIVWSDRSLFGVAEDAGKIDCLLKFESSKNISKVEVLDEANLLVGFIEHSPIILNVNTEIIIPCKTQGGELVSLLCKELALFRTRSQYDATGYTYWILHTQNRTPLAEVEAYGRSHHLQRNCFFVGQNDAFPKIFNSTNGEKISDVAPKMVDENMFQFGAKGWLPFSSDKIVTWISEADRILYHGSQFSMLKIWDLASGMIVSRIKTHSDQTSGVIVTPTGDLVSWTSAGEIRIWDGKNNGNTELLRAHTGTVSEVILLPDGKLASYSEDGTIVIWDMTEWNGVANSTEPLAINETKWIGYFAVEEKLICWTDNLIELWNVEKNECLRQISLPDEAVGMQGVQKVNADCFVMWKGCKLWLWNSANLSLLASSCLKDEQEGKSWWQISFLTCVGTIIVAIRNHQDVFVLKSSTLEILNEFCCKTDNGLDGGFVTGDNRLVILERSKALVWDQISVEKKLGEPHTYVGTIFQHVVPFGDHHFAAWWEKEISICDASREGSISVLGWEKHEGYNCLVGVLPLPDSKTLLCWYSGNKLRMLNSDSRIYEGELLGHTAIVLGAQVFHDNCIVSYAADGGIILWDMNMGDKREAYQAHTGPVCEVKLFNDGSMVSFSDYEVILRKPALTVSFNCKEGIGEKNERARVFSDGLALPSHDYVSWLSKAVQNQYISGNSESEYLIIFSGGKFVRLLPIPAHLNVL